MNDAYFDALEEMDQRHESEAELYYAIMDALQSAKTLGLNDDHLKTLCYAAGVQFDDLD